MKNIQNMKHVINKSLPMKSLQVQPQERMNRLPNLFVRYSSAWGVAMRVGIFSLKKWWWKLMWRSTWRNTFDLVNLVKRCVIISRTVSCTYMSYHVLSCIYQRSLTYSQKKGSQKIHELWYRYGHVQYVHVISTNPIIYP